MEIESSDVIRLVMQFLHENKLEKTLLALREESNVSSNVVDNVELFIADIKAGRWDSVLRQVQSLELPSRHLMDLFEHVIIEMLELRELEVARTIMRRSEPMQVMKEEQPDRYSRLERLIGGGLFDLQDAYPGSTKERRRGDIARALADHVSVVPPSRLLALLGQALKWQQSQGLLPEGTKLDIFRGTAPKERQEDDRPPRKKAVQLKLDPKFHAESAIFTPDGQHLVTGTVDGFIEVWDYMKGEVRKDLQYQKDEKYMVHKASPILAMTASHDSELLATGSRDGKLKVWKISTGQCMRKFPKAHDMGITSICFSKDSTQLLTASFDATARIHGLRSGRTLKYFRGHSSYVNDAVFNVDNTYVVTASSDGHVRVWDSKTTDCVQTIRPPQPSATSDLTVSRIVAVPRQSDQIYVCNRSTAIYKMGLNGQVLQTFKIEQGPGSGHDFVTCAVSPQGKWLYALSEDKMMYVFNAATAALEQVTTVAEGEVIGMSHHPHRNWLAVFSEDGQISILRA